MALTNEELRETNKLIFGYIPEIIGNKELRLIEKKIRFRNYYKLFLYEGIAKLFLEAQIDSTTGCWIKGKSSMYRKIRMIEGRKTLLAHRVSYNLIRGPIPDGLYICHFCDRPVCVNPFHLFTGTMRENFLDYKLKFNPTPKYSVERNEQGQVIKVIFLEPLN